jgi:hypothetical protein
LAELEPSAPRLPAASPSVMFSVICRRLRSRSESSFHGRRLGTSGPAPAVSPADGPAGRLRSRRESDWSSP